MKKILLCLSLFVFLISPVYAKENRLYFTEKDDRLYYESEFLDEEVFMKHTEMVPGDSYTDELIIENGTKQKYTLYFRVDAREQSSEADELLENILMKITLDDVVIYDGMATGLDYTEEGVDLQQTVLLGDFNTSDKYKMVVETKLSEDYDNKENIELSEIDWSFYAQYDKETPSEIIKLPNTMKNSFPITIVFSVIIVLIGFGIIGYATRKQN